MRSTPALQWMTGKRNRLSGELARAEISPALLLDQCESLRQGIAEIEQVGQPSVTCEPPQFADA